MNKEELQKRMLNNVDKKFDRSEGSFFYDALKPVAIELEGAYNMKDEILNNGFALTAKGDYLDKKVAEQGLQRRQATKATTYVEIRGKEGTKIPKGCIVASDTATYKVIEMKDIPKVINNNNLNPYFGENVLKMDAIKAVDSIAVDNVSVSTVIESGKANVLVECEQSGKIGNAPVGAIKHFPVTIAGLKSVTNKKDVINGYNEETDEELRERYFEKVRTPATSGNRYHYKNWAKEVPGVGDAKVKPTWNGAGTVKVVIINSNKTVADETLINAVKAHIEENRPIGVDVTLASAGSKVINIKITVEASINTDEKEELKSNIEDIVKLYLKKIAFVENRVSYAMIVSLIMDCKGADKITNITLNDNKENITVGELDVAVLGAVTIE
ncbi:baseplate J/gp47 family protein [Clostridiaceae bacterium M8S5]|nr:baseplate J/gp47 family protein [Clostridiaceae bacterium M8S5]